jgi:hypothetical protein
VFTYSAGSGRAEGDHMDYGRSERERLRGECCKAWSAMRTIRAALEEHAPKGTLPEQEFLADFPEEAAAIVAALKRVLTQGVKVRALRGT